MFTARYDLIFKYYNAYYFICHGSWFIRRPITAETRVRFRFNLCEICNGHIGTGTGFKESNSIFTCHYNPTNAS
jgi:hypothetical protein